MEDGNEDLVMVIFATALNRIIFTEASSKQYLPDNENHDIAELVQINLRTI